MRIAAQTTIARRATAENSGLIDWNVRLPVMPRSDHTMLW